MTHEEYRARSIPQILEIIQAYWTAAEQATLYEREQQLTLVLQRLGACLLATSLDAEAAAPAEPDLPCPCGGTRRYAGRPHSRTMQTLVGAITVSARARYRCATCHQSSYPVDTLWDLEPQTRMSRYLQAQCTYVATLVPYEQASAILAQLCACAVCPSQIWHAVQQAGVQEEAEQQAAYATLQSQPDPVPQTTGHQYVSADGVMYCGRDKAADGTAQWHELKTSAVYDAEAAPVPAAHRAADVLRHHGDATLPTLDQAGTITYAASARSWSDLGHQTQVELQRRGPQQERIALGDGAESVQSFFDTFARASGVRLTRILDLRHAEQHLWDIAERLPEGTRTAWWEQALVGLEGGNVAALTRLLQACAATWTDRPTDALAATRAVAYFTRHAAHIDYVGFIDRHYQITSSIAESTCKRFGVDRMKGTGMRWGLEGAHHLAILRAKVLNHRWPATLPSLLAA